MRSFANFIQLRNSEHAQLEIKEVAAEMLRQITEVAGKPFDETLKAFEKRRQLNSVVNELLEANGGDVAKTIEEIKDIFLPF
jgi:thymidylate synthase ThyX